MNAHEIMVYQGGGQGTRRISVDLGVDLRGMARPESDSEGEEEFQDSREGPPLMDPMELPPVPTLAWSGSVSEGYPNVTVCGRTAV